MTRQRFPSWGRFPAAEQTALVPAWLDAVADGFAQARGADTTLAYGNGRSYGDSCLAQSGRILALRGLDRLIQFDRESGRVVAQAGMTLAELSAVTLPAGWFLPVSPGTALATLGGAVANDVHGKNHHVRGTLGRHVLAIGLLRSDRGLLVCSPRDETELFAATVGGLGLTGVMLWVELQLMPVSSDRIDSIESRFGSLDEFFSLSDEQDPRHEYSVAWVDVMAGAGRRGRGIYAAGDHAAGDHAAAGPQTTATQADARHAPAGHRLSVPLELPISAVQRWTVRPFNSLWFHRAPAGPRRRQVDLRSFFYPLDGIGRWNRLYGPRGFQQFQCVIPERWARPAIASLLDAIARAGEGSFLAVLKRCGDLPSPGLLSFPIRGTSLALDFAHHDRLHPLLERLDAIVREAEGRLYPAKDAHMSGSDFRRAYPSWSVLEAARDPALLSRFWSRVTDGA